MFAPYTGDCVLCLLWFKYFFTKGCSFSGNSFSKLLCQNNSVGIRKTTLLVCSQCLVLFSLKNKYGNRKRRFAKLGISLFASPRDSLSTSREISETSSDTSGDVRKYVFEIIRKISDILNRVGITENFTGSQPIKVK